jgi:hypothetical protein
MTTIVVPLSAQQAAFLAWTYEPAELPHELDKSITSLRYYLD